MKTTIAALIASAVVTSVAITASAQPNDRPQTQRAALPESYATLATVEHPAMSFAEVKAITESSVREAISDHLRGITASEMTDRITNSFRDITGGNPVSFSAPISGLSGHSITEQYSMNVTVHYEPRPIGGILSIRVELLPVFCGIGSASRPAAYRELSRAVDDLDEDALGEAVSSLTHDLGEEYATR